MIQSSVPQRNSLGEALQEIVDGSLDWLSPTLGRMLEAIRYVSSDEEESAATSSYLLSPPALLERIRQKTLDYLTGQNGPVRLALIDQNDFDMLVEELSAYREEIDRQDTVLGFIEKHLGRLLNRRIVRDSNPYSLRNLAHFTLEALAEQGVGHGVRRALLRAFLEHAVPSMRTGLWDLANALEPLVKQISSQPAAELDASAMANWHRDSRMSTQPPGQSGPPGPQTPSTAVAESGSAQVNSLDRVLNALDSFEHYLANHGQTTGQPAPGVIAQWASQAAADATMMKGVMASSLLTGVHGLEQDAHLPLDALTAVLMEQVTRDNEALVRDASHPVRRLLNRLFATLASGPTAEEVPKLNEWVESASRVLLHHPQHASALLEDLERLGAPSAMRRRDRLLERQLELESWHRMLRAKQRSKEALDNSLQGLSLHREAAAFIRQYWVHVLSMIALRHNPGTRVWSDAQDLARALGSCPLRPEQVEILETIAKRELGAYFSSEDAAQALGGWLQQLDEAPSEANTLSWKRTPTLEDVQRAPVEAAAKPILGSWVRFADKPWPYPLQLIWSSVPFGYLGFTDASAERSFRMEVSEWARHVAAGRTEDYGLTSFEEMPALLDRNLESWTYENQLLSTLRDGSTGLLNRRGLAQAIASRDADEPQPAWQLLIMELPRLAEQYLGEGQMAGENALSKVVGVLRSQNYPGLILARLGETRFAAAAPQAEAGLVDVFRPVLERHCEALQEGWFFHLGYCPEGPSDEGLIQAAEEAVEVARAAGQNSLEIKAIGESRLESWMRATTRIIREGKLELHAQPMRALKAGLLPHAEILLRLKSEDDLYHSPALFLREAERQKLMPQVDLWVLRSLGDWLQGRSQLPQHWSGLAVNLSGQTLSDPASQAAITSWLSQSGVDPTWLIFEITETSAVANLEQAGEFLRGLRDRGCRTALDDFGTGYANYTYLRELPFDYLKIDGSFVRNLVDSEADRALVGSMAEVARRFGLKSVAEYVHSADLLPILQELGVDYAQGYALGEPLPLCDVDVQDLDPSSV